MSHLPIISNYPFFISNDKFICRKDERGDYEFAVLLDRETTDFQHLIGKHVIIDDKVYKCIGVNRFSHMPPWRQGEPVGLRVEKI
jgi:hypothetical protein